MNAFTALGVSAALTDIMKLQGIVKPTPIQEASIPSIFKEGCHRPFPDRYGQDACLPAACNPESGYRKEYDAGPHHDADERTLQTDF